MQTRGGAALWDMGCGKNRNQGAAIAGENGGGQRVIAMGAVWELGGRGGASEKCLEMDKWGARRKEGDVRKRGRDASPW